MGIEIEYWVIDQKGDLTTSDEIITRCDGVDPEMNPSLLEVKTPPCDTFEELVSTLCKRLQQALSHADSEDKRLVPLGTPLSDENVTPRMKPRIEIQRAVIGEDLKHAGQCAGTHLHFEQTNVVDQLRVLTALDPALALVNTSPYYRGTRLTTCARPQVYRRHCYREFPGHGQLWEYPATASEWRDRIQTRFETFIAAAQENGVSKDAVESVFSPGDAIWAPVCLRDDLGTVEWRVPDAAAPLELCRLAAEIREIMVAAVERGTQIERYLHTEGDTFSLPSFERLCEYVDTAIEEGLSAPEVRQYLSRFGFDVQEYEPFGEKIDGLDKIDTETAQMLRLQASDRLEEDIRYLAGFSREATVLAGRQQKSN